MLFHPVHQHPSPDWHLKDDENSMRRRNDWDDGGDEVIVMVVVVVVVDFVAERQNHPPIPPSSNPSSCERVLKSPSGDNYEHFGVFKSSWNSWKETRNLLGNYATSHTQRNHLPEGVTEKETFVWEVTVGAEKFLASHMVSCVAVHGTFTYLHTEHALHASLFTVSENVPWYTVEWLVQHALHDSK